MEESGLLLLPDDALLAVLAYVAPRQLLNLRVLCRRLRDICLHPDLWRSVHLHFNDKRLLLAALRLVPCLGGLTLEFPNLLRLVASEISTCTCVVACLDLYIEDESDLVSATAIAKKVAALGGMRALSLYVEEKLPIQPLPALLKMLYSTRQLRELDLTFHAKTLMGPWRGRELEGTAFLKRLSFSGQASNGELLESLLRTHAATLEHVGLSSFRLPSSLKDLPKLQSLTFDLEDYYGKKNDDLSVLAELADLETLHISSAFVTHFPPEVLDFLRRSSSLRSVKMPLPKENPSAPLLALAASRAARGLQILSLIFHPGITGNDSRQKVLEALAALTLFPSLQDLYLGSVSPVVFQLVVSSMVAPSLRTLEVSDEDECCAHSSLHDVNVQNLLARNPQLHLWPGPIIIELCDCQWCESGCHKELERFKCVEGPALASHAKRIGCPANCFQFEC